MTTRTQKILGWTPTVLIAVFLIVASAMPKLLMSGPGSSLLPFFESLGMTHIAFAIGLLELACGVLLLIPRTSTVGFILTVGLLGGALATGLTHPNAQGVMPAFPIGMLLLMSFGAYFRNPELLDRAAGRPVPKSNRIGLVFAWIATALVSFLNIFAAIMKFVPQPTGTPGADFMAKLGVTPGMEHVLGVLELAIVILFLLPRTSAVGLVLMVGYMGGAIATNLTHGFGTMDVLPLYVSLALIAVTGYFRNPELASRLLGRKA